MKNNLVKVEGHLTRGGRRMKGAILYDRGKNFLGAGLLIQRQGGSAFVAQHLYCQALELILKALLLLKVERFGSGDMRKIGHRLDELAARVRAEFRLTPLTAKQIATLTSWAHAFGKGELRYDVLNDMFGGPSMTDTKRLRRQVIAVIRASEPYVRGVLKAQGHRVKSLIISIT